MNKQKIKKPRRTESANHRVATTPTHSLLIPPSLIVVIFIGPGIGLSSGAPNPDHDSLQQTGGRDLLVEKNRIHSATNS